MEQKHVLFSALGLGVGVGLGVGLRLASGQTGNRWSGNSPYSNVITAEQLEQELLRQVVDGRDSGVTFEGFPYYLSEQTKVLLVSAAYVHLKHAEVSKYTKNLSPASRAILLSGPTELYHQVLAKAVAHYFEAKLLLFDATDFSLKIQGKYGSVNKESLLARSPSESTLERLSDLLGSFSIISQKEESKGSIRRQYTSIDLPSRGIESSDPPNLRRNVSASANICNLASQYNPGNTAQLKHTSSWSFDEKLLVQSIYRVLVGVSKSNPMVLYLKDVEKLLFRSQRICNLFEKMLKKLSGPVLILASRTIQSASNCRDVDERLASLFPYNLEIKPPEDETYLVSWKSQLEEDMKMIRIQDNKNHIMEILSCNDLNCDDLDKICVSDTEIISNYIEEIVVSAISYHLMNNKDPEYRNGKLVISSESLSHGLNIFQEGKSIAKDEQKSETSMKKGSEDTSVALEKEKKSVNLGKSDVGKAVGAKTDAVDKSASKAPEMAADNEFEKRIRPEVISASELSVSFADIGALDEIKECLQELVMLPLKRPDLFQGGLLKPCRGILLFGPPGTGKTMLAKAIAKEAGASFINVSMSTITSKWFGEDEKNVRALFTLAAKVAPTIIFVDEVDSMLGQRTRVGEHEAMRKIKNEFMSHWDGLMTKQGERILVLAATNRPFDLDEAIIRRFERRILVGLPSMENREMILKTLLEKEKIEEGLNFKEIATMTDGYTGSDLKTLCTTAAFRPIRELIQHERLKDLEKKKRICEAQKSGEQAALSNGNKEERVISLRALNMRDFKLAKEQVATSFAAEGSMMSELKQWNDLYGEGGSRKKQQLPYFL